MAFNDWDFFTRVTEDTIPSDISFTAGTPPLSGLKSLQISDSGSPAVATAAGTLKVPQFKTLLSSGRIQSLFERKTGSGFRDQGFFFLSSGRNPLNDGVNGYAVYMIDGGATIRIVKFTNGLHDMSSEVTLSSLSSTTTGSQEPVAMEVEWFGGLFSTINLATSIEVRFSNNTTVFSGLSSLSTVLDQDSSRLITGHVGFFARSRNSIEPLDVLIDDTSIWERDFT